MKTNAQGPTFIFRKVKVKVKVKRCGPITVYFSPNRSGARMQRSVGFFYVSEWLCMGNGDIAG